MKQIIKNFNNLISRTIFKVQNKTNNNFNISSFNKYLISFIVLLFIYIFYLLIPILYDKTWVQTNIESKLLDEFKVIISSSADISYRILPAPHFLIKNSKILVGKSEKKKSIAEIKNLKVFLSQQNFFDKEKMNIKKIIINNANFSLLRDDIKLLSDFKNKKFHNKKIKVNDSNIFFKDNLGDIISIIKIYKTTLFFDDKKLLNFLNLKGEVFNVPFNLDFQHKNNSVKYEKFNFNSKFLNLNIFNESYAEKNKLTTGKNIISFSNSTIDTRYSIKEKLIIFKSSNSITNNSQVNYSGDLSINPFDLDLKINIDNYKVSKLFNINPILIEFIKSGLLFNDNISVSTSIIINSNAKNEIFQNAKINFNIINGLINFDKTNFVNNSIGSMQVRNSNLFLKNNKLKINSNLFINIKNSENLFSFLNTSKSSRRSFQKILINLDYTFLGNQLKFNSASIDNNEFSDQLFSIIEGFEDNNLNNVIKNRKLINELLRAYSG